MSPACRPSPAVRVAPFARALAWFAVLLVAAAITGPARADAPPAIDARAPLVEIEAAARWLPGADAATTAADARAALAAGRFAPLPRGRAQFGFAADTVWLAVALDNPGDTALRRTLLLGHARLDRIDLHVDDGRAPARHVVLGDTLPFAQRARPMPQPNVDLVLPAGGRVTVLARVQSTSALQVPMTLAAGRPLERRHTREVAGDALYFGLLAGLLLYNLSLFFAIRERTYLLYVLYVLAFGALMLAYTGIGFQVLWPESPWFANVSVPLFTALLLAATTAFQREFLALKLTVPTLEPWFRHGAWVLVVIGLASTVLPMRVATIAANLGTLVMSLFAIAGAVFCVIRGFKPAVYFLIAWTVLIAGGVLVPLKNFGILTSVPYAEHALQIGSALEMVLLAFALAYRINLLRGENERLLREARVNLEARVDERTRALHEALSDLEVANRHLRESSRRDGLTGVYNRRYLDIALADHQQRAQQHQLPLSLLMIDLDRFKSINDRHGHTAGDECLRAVAARIAAMVEERAEATVARYGGEEFVVMLPMTDAMAATALAERLRQTIARVPVATAAGDIPVTISVGVATLMARELREAGGTSLLQRADQALYQAKRSGRNLVVAA